MLLFEYRPGWFDSCDACDTETGMEAWYRIGVRKSDGSVMVQMRLCLVHAHELGRSLVFSTLGVTAKKAAQAGPERDTEEAEGG